MLIRRSVVAGSLISLVVAGLAAQPGAVVASASERDPGLLEPQDVPLVPEVPLPTPDYEAADSDLAESSSLPEDVSDLPDEASATVPADESWSEVPELPVEVAVEEPATPSDPEGTQPDAEDGVVSNVPQGADLEVQLIRPEDLGAGVLMLDVGIAAEDADAPSEEPTDPQTPEPSDEPTPTVTAETGDPTPTEPSTDGSPDPTTTPEPSGPATSETPESSPTSEPTGEPSDEPSDEPTTPPSGAELVPAEGVSVRVSYSDFDQLFGARWADRLGVIAYPACFVTTPEDPGCTEGTRVESVNDPATEELSFTTVPAAEVTSDADAVTPSALAAADGSDGVVYALVAGPGSFEATPFNSATSWQAGTGSGEFSYSYPFELPKALGGATPSLALNYSSAMVDTMTAQNMGASAVGTGWSEMAPAFISRSFASCDEDQDAGEDEFDDLGDKCWTTRTIEEDGQMVDRVVEEMSLSMNGRSSRLRLVKRNVDENPNNPNPDVVTDEFRLYDDPGWRVWRRTDATPAGTGLADNDGERWIVTTPDGTQYHFGTRTSAHATWTVPVFGNDAGEPCHGATMGGSVCQQAWQWNLDRTVDPHGNEVHYDYTVETNHYKQLGASNPVEYHRAGTLSRIEYGFWSDPTVPSDTVGPPRQAVTISTAPRCLDALTSPGASCPISGSGVDRSRWTDVPLDLVCTSGSCTQTTPSFFSTRRYTKVETFTYEGSGAGTQLPVSVYTLGHTLPDINTRTIVPVPVGGDNVEADLWLQSVQLTGRLGFQNTEIPEVYFEGKIFDNRIVQAGSAEDRMERFRLFAVRNELGGRIDVFYGHKNPCDASMWNRQQVWWDPAGDVKECFATINPDNDERDWFHKYLVTQVALSDDALRYRVGVGTPDSDSNLGTVQVFEYDYRGKPAWRFGASRNTPNDLETWHDWRGYEETVVRSLNRDNDPASTSYNSITRTVRFRGMNGSRINNNGLDYDGVRISTAEPDDGEPLGGGGQAADPLDEPWLNGMTAETDVQHPNGDLIERDYTGYKWWTYASAQQANAAKRVYVSRTVNTVRTTSGASPGLRRHVVDYVTYDGGANSRGIKSGALRSVWDHGNPGTSTDDTCTVTDWKTNDTEWIHAQDYTQLHEGSCTELGAATGNPIGFTENFYDHEEDDSANPLIRGLLTQSIVHTANPAGNDDEPITTQTDYDDYGRVTETRVPGAADEDPDNRTITEYNPGGSPGNLLTELHVTQVQDPGPDLVTRTTLEPAKGLPVAVENPNGDTTRMTYDGLGRTKRMFAPRNTQNLLTGTPTVEHIYTNSLRDHVDDPVTQDNPARVRTETQLGDPITSTQTTRSYVFYDGWGRLVESHQDSPTAGRRIVTSTGYDDQGLAEFTTAAYSVTNTATGQIVNPNPTTVPEYSLTHYDAAGRPTKRDDKNLTSLYRTSTTTYKGDQTIQVPAGSGATITTTDVYDRPTKIELHKPASPAPGAIPEDSAEYGYTPAGQLAQITKTLPTSGSHAWKYSYDWAGRKVQAEDPDTGRTDYHYDPAGNLTQTDTYTTENSLHAKIATSYDDLNRPTLRRDVTNLLTSFTLAAWTYDTEGAFNGLGRLTETTTTVHPGLHGIAPPTGGSWTYTEAVTGYDEDGNVKGTQTRYPAWLTGQPATYPTSSPTHVVYESSSTYTATGEPDLVTYPATPAVPGYQVKHTYEPAGGRPATMKVNGTAQMLADARYDALGRTSSLSSYNTTDATLIRTYTYDDKAGRPRRVSATRTGPGTSTDPGTNNPTYLLDIVYQYDTADNPLRITANAQNTPGPALATGSWCYSYDGLNRLTRAFTGKPDNPQNLEASTTCTKPTTGSADALLVEAVTGPLHDLGYQYSGDRLWKVTTPGTPTPASTVTYDWSGTGPHRTRTITRSGANANGLPATTSLLTPITYWGTGNAASTPGSQDLRYDSQGRLIRDLSILGTADAVASQYAYRADGMRIARQVVKKSCLTCIRTTTVFLPDGTEISRDLLPLNPEPGKPALNSTRHITTPGGTPLGSIDYQGLTWTFADAANNVRITRKQASAGGTVTRPTYYPHGAPSNTTGGVTAVPGNRGYLNKTHDPSGDIRLDQRSYTPTLNVLTTPDPLLEPGDPQTLNPYAYARNNPVTLSDPSGLAYDTEAQAPTKVRWPVPENRQNLVEVDGPNHPFGVPPACPSGGAAALACYYNEPLPTYAGTPDPWEVSVLEGTLQNLGTSAPYEFAFKTAVVDYECGGFTWACAFEVGTFGPLRLLKLLKPVIKHTDEGVDAASPVTRQLDNCPTNSFTGDTLVLMADGNRTSIEDVKLGDEVMATDPETGERGPRKVVDLIRHGGMHTMVAVRLADGSTINATDQHPFWVQSSKAWVNAINLEPGDVVVTAYGDRLSVENLGISEQHQTVYNLTVLDLHTYFAGGPSVLVHNAGCTNMADLPESATRNLTQDANYAFTRLRDNHGLTRVEFREQVHMIKRNEALPADFDLTFGPTGDVWNPSSGELIGSLIHGH